MTRTAYETANERIDFIWRGDKSFAGIIKINWSDEVGCGETIRAISPAANLTFRTYEAAAAFLRGEAA